MNRVFSISAPFHVPDGTLVSPFLNAKDSESALPFDILNGFSIAAGVIPPKVASKIHIMPFVTQVTFVRSGVLTVRMKSPLDHDAYQLDASAGDAILTEPKVLFQLINSGAEACEVLYIVSPAYVFEMSNDRNVLYDDSLVLQEDWNDLAGANWQLSQALPIFAQRQAALQRLAQRKHSNDRQRNA